MKKFLVGLLVAVAFLSPVAPAQVATYGTAHAQGYSAAVEQWRPTVEAACGGGAGCIERIMWLISCESAGVEYIQSKQINPGTGMYDYGLLQISPIWGDVAYAGGVTQIHWAAAHLGSVWWAC